MSKPRWYACDMDDGILRVTGSYREARAWALRQFGGQVLSRHKYGHGSYELVLGYPGEEWTNSVFVVREDRMERAGMDPAQAPLYPYPDRPHEDAPRTGTEASA